MNRKIKGLLLIMTLVLILSACNDKSFDLSNRPSRQDEYSLKEFHAKEFNLAAENIEELEIEDAQILEKSNLNILYLKDGMFYGMGHHPSEDGSKIYSKYKFDFDGNIEEELFLGDFKSAMDTEEFIWKNSGVVRREDNEYYYVNLIDGFNTIIKVDFDSMDEEVVRTFEGDIISMYWIDDEYLYYDQDDLEGSILRLNLKTDEVYMLEEPEVFKDAYISILGKSGVEHRNLYYQAVDGPKTDLYEFDYREGVLSNLVSIEGATGVDLTQETLDRDNFHWTILNDMKSGMSLVWNSSNKDMEYILKLDLDEEIDFLTSYEDRKFIYRLEDEKLLLVDIDEETRTEIDMSEIIKRHSGGNYEFYLDDEYAYVHWMDDGNKEEEKLEKDRFYRIKL